MTLAGTTDGWNRVPTVAVRCDGVAGTRHWVRQVEDGTLRVIRSYERDSEENPWRLHLSISHSGPDGAPGRYPTWDEQRDAVRAFCADRPMASIMPTQEEYVNVHPTTFHWWEIAPDEITTGGAR